jgi:V/A-type H+-transporting ATPase subunit B
MAAVVGEAGLSEPDRRALGFAERFEREFLSQPDRRSLADTIAVGWRLLESLPRDDLFRISEAAWAQRTAAPERPGD